MLLPLFTLSLQFSFSPHYTLAFIMRSVTAISFILRFGSDLFLGVPFLHQAKARCYFFLSLPISFFFITFRLKTLDFLTLNSYSHHHSVGWQNQFLASISNILFRMSLKLLPSSNKSFSSGFYSRD